MSDMERGVGPEFSCTIDGYGPTSTPVADNVKFLSWNVSGIADSSGGSVNSKRLELGQYLVGKSAMERSTLFSFKKPGFRPMMKLPCLVTNGLVVTGHMLTLTRYVVVGASGCLCTLVLRLE